MCIRDSPYTITVTKDGETTSQNDVYLALDEVSQVDMSVGAQELEAIQVTGSGVSQVFASDKMGSGSNIDSQKLQAFASVNRNLQDYARLDPRVSQTDKSRNEISVGGQNPRYNAIRVDGISTNDAFGLESNSLPTPRQPFSMDTIDEPVPYTHLDVYKRQGSNDPSRLTDWSVALLVAWAGTAAILFSATYRYRWLGQRVLTAVERLMGMLLVAISVQMLMDGIATYLKVQGATIGA